jgi:hypothetical protein
MGKKASPPQITPEQSIYAAQQTSQSNQDAQTRADWANRPTQNTPWGQSSWQSQAAVDPATGKPVTNWTQNITLDPRQQQALDSEMAVQQGRTNIAQGMIGRLDDAYKTPFDWSNMQAPGQAPTAGQGMMGGLGDNGSMAARTRIEDAMWQRMQPQHQQQQGALDTQLANMGLTRGSEAWNREQQRLGDQQSRERFNVMDRGLAEQQGQFGMGLQAGQFQNQAQQQQFGQGMQTADYANKLRQQQIAEQMQKRGMPLNELNALLTGQQVGMPSMPSFNTSQSAGGTNYTGALQQSYNSAMDGYNAQQAKTQGMMGGLAGLASTGVQAGMMFSDARLKTDIVRVGTHPLGIGIYDYTMFGERMRGVLAHEVREVAPHLVHEDSSGYLMVNYAGLA